MYVRTLIGFALCLAGCISCAGAQNNSNTTAATTNVTECQYVYFGEGDYGFINSSNYPHPFPDKVYTECWTLQTQLSHQINLSFVGTPAFDWCDDVLVVLEGGYVDRVSYNSCVALGGQMVQSNSSLVSIIFNVTHNMWSDNGFSIRYESSFTNYDSAVVNHTHGQKYPNATTTPNNGTECKYIFFGEGDYGYINSSNYPYPFPDKVYTECWTLQTQLSHQINLSFVGTPAFDWCDDVLVVLEGGYVDRVSYNSCAALGGQMVQSNSSSVSIIFNVTHNMWSDNGFSIRYESSFANYDSAVVNHTHGQKYPNATTTPTNGTECKYIFFGEGDYGFINSSNYPYPFPDKVYTECWTLQTHLRDRIKLSFIGSPSFDYYANVLVVLDGGNWDNVLYRSCCNTTSNQTIQSLSASVSIVFNVTHNMWRDRGFSIKYENAYTNINRATNHSSCKNISLKWDTYFSSNNFPMAYPQWNRECWFIRDVEGFTISIESLAYNIGSCDTASLVITEGYPIFGARYETIGGEVLFASCGATYPYVSVTSRTNALYVVFNSSSNPFADTGFRFHVKKSSYMTTPYPSDVTFNGGDYSCDINNSTYAEDYRKYLSFNGSMLPYYEHQKTMCWTILGNDYSNILIRVDDINLEGYWDDVKLTISEEQDFGELEIRTWNGGVGESSYEEMVLGNIVKVKLFGDISKASFEIQYMKQDPSVYAVHEGLAGWMIALIVLGIILFLACMILPPILFCCRSKVKKPSTTSTVSPSQPVPLVYSQPLTHAPQNAMYVNAPLYALCSAPDGTTVMIPTGGSAVVVQNAQTAFAGNQGGAGLRQTVANTYVVNQPGAGLMQNEQDPRADDPFTNFAVNLEKV